MAWNEFRAAARRSLARFEARWPQELELGLQELDARYEPIVDELKLFFTPQGVVPKLPRPASMAEVVRAHVDEVVQHIREREERLIEELRSELEAELQRCSFCWPPCLWPSGRLWAGRAPVCKSSLRLMPPPSCGKRMILLRRCALAGSRQQILGSPSLPLPKQKSFLSAYSVHNSGHAT